MKEPIKHIEIILPNTKETERTGIDTADVIDLNEETEELLLAYCNALGLDPAELIFRMINDYLVTYRLEKLKKS